MNFLKTSHTELHSFNDTRNTNWLRAAVLGANDGIVSVSSIVVGVAAAGSSPQVILTSGVAAVVAGALSMAVGEYVSVSTQRDTEKALLMKEQWELDNEPEKELEELTSIYEHKGLSRQTAQLVAEELTQKDAFAAHIDAELGINPDQLTNPWHAAYASALSFFVGAVIPLIVVIIAPKEYKTLCTFISAIFALSITGALSAHAGGASKRKATVRVVAGGIIAMIVTFGIGKLFGVSL